VQRREIPAAVFWGAIALCVLIAAVAWYLLYVAPERARPGVQDNPLLAEPEPALPAASAAPASSRPVPPRLEDFQPSAP